MKRNIKRALLLFCALILISATINYLLDTNNFGEIVSEKDDDNSGAKFGAKLQDGYLINTKGCRIPKSLLRKVKPKGMKMPDCKYEKTLSTINDDKQILQMSPKYVNSSCCLQTIERIQDEDNKYKLSKCSTILDHADVKDKEMFITRCGENLNFEANLKVTSNVQMKLESWDSISDEDLPTSVLFFGVDSISRSMARRCLPETIDMMKKMGFIDFKGYHSAGGSTFHNYAPFLMGLTRSEAIELCKQNWSTPFDSCPFIWKNYSDSGYITMYVEDGHQTFNWGGQGGFQRRPTDFYIHSLFNAMEVIRIKETYAVLKINETNENLETYAYCASRDSSPEFVKKYTERFLTKFIYVPTFSFTWFANPFHDYVGKVLPEYDRFFLDFFRFLNSTPKLLDNTLIAFASDHGDRGTNVKESSSNDLSLPFLYIRLPDRLQRRHPGEKIMQTIQENSMGLAGPLDLHQTFLHILHLQKRNTGFRTSPFEHDRLAPSSLLLPINRLRTCRDIKVENCVCDTLSMTERVMETDASLISRMNILAIERLNKFVSDSNYSQVCEKWLPTEGYMSTPVRITKEYREDRFQFEANPMKASFQINMRILKGDKLELVGDFLRTNMYRNQSWCVNFQTHLDKQMKELCVCKSE